MESTQVILFVADQQRARDFYRTVLGAEPSLDVVGMTEFPLPGGSKLGLMPIDGIRTLLPNLPDPRESRAPRCELYLLVTDPAVMHARALRAGATEVAPLTARDWGDDAAYSLDRDGHLIAFARPRSPTADSEPHPQRLR
ncbi:MAG: VOC family protein [Acidimicrobiia bacterium]